MALALVFIAGAVAADSALAFGKKKNEEPADPRGKAVNLNACPETVIIRGVLQNDGLGQWLLDDQALAFDKKSRIAERDDGLGEQSLQAGREAMVTAVPMGESLLVRRIYVISADESVERGILNPKISTSMPETREGNIPQ